MDQELPPNTTASAEVPAEEPATILEAPAHRPDGKGYIDDADSQLAAESEGSSVEESLDSADERSHGGWPEEDGANFDNDDEDDVDWDVENEDWELADGGECC